MLFDGSEDVWRYPFAYFTLSAFLTKSRKIDAKRDFKNHCRRGASPPHPLDTSRWKQNDRKQEIGRHRWIGVEKGRKNIPKPLKSHAPKINPKSMKNRGCVADAFLERVWAALGRQKLATTAFSRTILGAIFDQKSKKCIQKGIQTSMPKKLWKLMPNGYKMRPTWIPTSLIFFFRKRRKRSRPFVFQ